MMLKLSDNLLLVKRRNPIEYNSHLNSFIIIEYVPFIDNKIVIKVNTIIKATLELFLDILLQGAQKKVSELANEIFQTLL